MRAPLHSRLLVANPQMTANLRGQKFRAGLVGWPLDRLESVAHFCEPTHSDGM